MITIKKLRETYPKLFIDNPDISIREGWYPILEKVCILLMEYNTLDPDIRFVQIKEKFAEIRIYIEAANLDKEKFTEVHDKLEIICEESRSICEFCGTKENVKSRPGAWIKTLCNDCHEK